MSVHDIDVQEVGSGSFHGCYFFGQPGKISS
jgi:hypothetical protein